MALHSTTEIVPIWTDRTADPRVLSPTLSVLAGEHVGRRFRVKSGLLLGRDEDCTIRFTTAGVSRRHAEVVESGKGEFVLRDLGSRNGISVNNQPVRGEHTLQLGDRVRIAGACLLLYTRHDELEEEFLHRQRMESIGVLAGGVAHDFNNLLSAIMSNILYLQDLHGTTPLGDADVQDVLRDVSTSAERAASLTNELLAVARRSPAEQRPVDVSALINEVASVIKRRLITAKVQAEIVATEPLWVLGDPVQLHQVLLNLSLNAVDAMPNGGRLRIFGRADNGGRGGMTALGDAPQVRIDVIDDGLGMPTEVQERAFEPFFTTKKPGRGTGLGLATSYGIVTAHGGHIQLDSVEGRGTTITVHLPMLAEAPDAVATIPPPPPRAPEHRGWILLVDDEDLNLRSGRRLLSLLGFQVEIAASGERALELLRKTSTRFDAIILDLLMPGLSGRETLLEIQQLDPRQPVLIATGYSDPEELRSLPGIGPGRILRKPYGRPELESALANVTRPAAPGP